MWIFHLFVLIFWWKPWEGWDFWGSPPPPPFPQENDFPYIIWQTLMNVNIHLYYYENLSRNCGGGWVFKAPLKEKGLSIYFFETVMYVNFSSIWINILIKITGGLSVFKAPPLPLNPWLPFRHFQICLNLPWGLEYTCSFTNSYLNH